MPKTSPDDVSAGGWLYPLRTASWVIREKATRKVLFETFNRKIVEALNTDRYEAIPILEYLQSLNRKETT